MSRRCIVFGLLNIFDLRAAFFFFFLVVGREALLFAESPVSITGLLYTPIFPAKPVKISELIMTVVSKVKNRQFSLSLSVLGKEDYTTTFPWDVLLPCQHLKNVARFEF